MSKLKHLKLYIKIRFIYAYDVTGIQKRQGKTEGSVATFEILIR